MGLLLDENLVQIEQQIRNYLYSVSLLRKQLQIRQNISQQISSLMQQKKLLKQFNQELKDYKIKAEQIRNKIIAKDNIWFSVQEIQKHYQFILPTLQNPQNYGLTDPHLPISFTAPFIQDNSIQQSLLFFWYTGNSKYLQLTLPHFTYIQNTKKNLLNLQQINPLKFQIQAKDLLIIQFSSQNNENELFAKKYQENAVVIFTTDQRTPSILQYRQDYPQVVSVSQNMIIKAIVAQKGMFESEILELDIRIVKGDQQVGEFTNNMERPLFFLSEDSNQQNSNMDMQQFEEELMKTNNFISWHENQLSTPKES